MKLRLAKIKEYLAADREFDTSIDVSDKFIYISIRYLETDTVINRSIELETLQETQLQRTKFIIDEIDIMKGQVRGDYY